MSIIASCGHELPYNNKLSLGRTISIRDWDRENDPVINYLTVCETCYRMYKLTNSILETEDEEKEWMENN